MAQIAIKILIRPDPDIRETCEGILALIKAAYNRGVISWARRGEMLDEIAEDLSPFVAIRNYEVPSDDPGAVILGYFVEPSTAFLAEVGLT